MKVLNFREKINIKAQIIVAFTIFILISSSSLTSTLVFGKSPYDSGYDHGCSDAKISDFSKHYIKQPGKGPDQHTVAFMQGYDAGLSECSRNLSSSDAHPITITKGKNSFIVQVTFVDRPGVDGPVDVNLYIEEYPQYNQENIDLTDAMYDDNPKTPDGQYTTQLTMPSGLIKDGQAFFVCVDDANSGVIWGCFELINGIKKGPEKITIGI